MARMAEKVENIMAIGLLQPSSSSVLMNADVIVIKGKLFIDQEY